jgi:hypothetical protein
MTMNTPRTISEIDAEIERLGSVNAEIESRPYHIAMVIDGVAQQVFHVEERLAAILLSDPTIVQCSSPANGGPDTGWTYDSSSNTFSKPA